MWIAGRTGRCSRPPPLHLVARPDVRPGRRLLNWVVREETQTDGTTVGGSTPAFRLLQGSGRFNSNPCRCSGNGGGDEFERNHPASAERPTRTTSGIKALPALWRRENGTGWPSYPRRAVLSPREQHVLD